MSISEFTIEDFIYDAGFRKWVLDPDADSEKYWDGILLEYPHQSKTVVKAREILLQMESREYNLAESEFYELWDHIDSRTHGSEKEGSKIIPLYPYVDRQIPNVTKVGILQTSQSFRIGAILILSFCLGALAAMFQRDPQISEQHFPIVFEEHHTERGVKSHLTLSDGSNIILNSGSSIKYVKGFDNDKREVVLDGEAYFDVFEDAQRPFIVKKGEVSITALGTAFNVEAYGAEDLNISLVSGRVAVGLHEGQQPQVLLEKGESLHVKPVEGVSTKALFNEDEVLGWTKKIIIFKKAPVSEAIRVLENWYRSEFVLENKPSPGLLISGRFENETLENVLNGLSYTTQLHFKIIEDTVYIRF